MVAFGDFAPLCHQLPSYPWCNLFYKQLLKHHDNSALTGASANRVSAPVGINPECGILRLGHGSSTGNIANIVACAVSILFVLTLILGAHRRKAAVGRVELRHFFVLYLLTLPFQLISTGSLLEQGSTALTVITAIHAGLVAATFWSLLANAIVATQVVEDGTLSSMIPHHFLAIGFFVATLYISLDTAFGFSHTFAPAKDPASLHNIGLFVLTNIWPAVAVILYFSIMLYIVLGVLNEVRPMWFFLLAFIVFVLSQLDFYLLNKVICKGSNQKVDGSFIATILETAAVGMLYLAWRSITEESWDDDVYYAR